MARGGKREGAGRKFYVPTPEQRVEVTRMVGAGMKHDRVAIKMGLNLRTMERHYRTELRDGAEIANAEVAMVLFKKATSPELTPATVTAAMFWLARRAGWTEANSLDVTVKTITDKPMTALEWAGKFADTNDAIAAIPDADFRELPSLPAPTKAELVTPPSKAPTGAASVPEGPGPGGSW